MGAGRGVASDAALPLTLLLLEEEEEEEEEEEAAPGFGAIKGRGARGSFGKPVIASESFPSGGSPSPLLLVTLDTRQSSTHSAATSSPPSTLARYPTVEALSSPKCARKGAGCAAEAAPSSSPPPEPLNSTLGGMAESSREHSPSASAAARSALALRSTCDIPAPLVLLVLAPLEPLGASPGTGGGRLGLLSEKGFMACPAPPLGEVGGAVAAGGPATPPPPLLEEEEEEEEEEEGEAAAAQVTSEAAPAAAAAERGELGTPRVSALSGGCTMGKVCASGRMSTAWMRGTVGGGSRIARSLKLSLASQSSPSMPSIPCE
jgi:hypothetical protein